MTLNEMLQSVRDDLGESGQHYWKNAELERYAYLVFNRLARQALCVEAEGKSNSLPGVQEYVMPRDFGELKDARYVDAIHDQPVPLTLTDKQSIVTTFGTLQTIGTPYLFYIHQDKMGLYPIPHKPPIIDFGFTGACETFSHIYDREASEPFTSIFEASVEYTQAANMNDALDPCSVQIGYISVHLRRKGLPYDGVLVMRLRALADDGYTIYSSPKLATSIGVRPEWHHFDFMLNPIELDETATQWELTIFPDEDYLAENPAEHGGSGIEIGVDSEITPYIQMHRHRKDIEIDYYRNACPRVVDKDEELDLPFYPPLRYHDLATDMITERALRKGQYDLPAANDYKQRNDKEIRYARAQAKVKTKGDIIRVPRHVRMRQNVGPYIDVINGRIVGRAW